MTAKFTYTEVKIQKCLVQADEDSAFFMCNNCEATSKTAKMFLLFKDGSDKTTEFYCEKHIGEHLEDYAKELVKGD